MGSVLRGIASSAYEQYASSQIPCAALPINKSDAFINQKHQIIKETNGRDFDPILF
jgi:hypothetical protein